MNDQKDGVAARRTIIQYELGEEEEEEEEEVSQQSSIY